MKLQDDILARYGVDKALHFLAGALIVALASVAGLLFFRGTGLIVGALAAILVTFILSYYKEKRLDERYDVLDIKAAMLGAGLTFILVMLMFFLYAVINGL